LSHKCEIVTDEPESTTLDRDSWFFWVDLYPAAAFGHPSLFLFVDPTSGTARQQPALWWRCYCEVFLYIVSHGERGSIHLRRLAGNTRHVRCLRRRRIRHPFRCCLSARRRWNRQPRGARAATVSPWLASAFS